MADREPREKAWRSRIIEYKEEQRLQEPGLAKSEREQRDFEVKPSILGFFDLES